MTCNVAAKGEVCMECGGRWICLRGARAQHATMFASPPPTEPKQARPRVSVLAVPIEPKETPT